MARRTLPPISSQEQGSGNRRQPPNPNGSGGRRKPPTPPITENTESSISRRSTPPTISTPPTPPSLDPPPQEEVANDGFDLEDEVDSIMANFGSMESEEELVLKPEEPETFEDEEDSDNYEYEDEEEDIEEEIIEPPPKPKKKESGSKKKKKKSKEEVQAEKIDKRYGKKKKKEKPDRVDKKNKKIRPIGAKRKEKIYDKDLDGRTNLMAFRKGVALFVCFILIAIFGVCLKNTLFPANNFTSDEIQTIAKQSVLDYGFPMERGEAVALEFSDAYWDFKPDDPASANKLSKFISGSNNASDSLAQAPGTAIDHKTQRSVVAGPYIFYSKQYSKDMATFKTTTLITDFDGSVATKEGKSVQHWVGLAFTVYYDEAKNQMIISRDSISVVPGQEMGNPGDLPIPADLGTGEEDSDMLKTLTPTIDGFIKAFADVTMDEHNDIDQYVPAKNKNLDLYNGFGGSVALADGTASIKKVVYKTEKSNEWKVDTTITWKEQETQDPHTAPTYTSRYVMTIKKTKDGKYVVTKFNPYVYQPKVNTETK